jgi:hypothetical protein
MNSVKIKEEEEEIKMANPTRRNKAKGKKKKKAKTRNPRCTRCKKCRCRCKGKCKCRKGAGGNRNGLASGAVSAALLVAAAAYLGQPHSERTPVKQIMRMINSSNLVVAPPLKEAVITPRSRR